MSVKKSTLERCDKFNELIKKKKDKLSTYKQLSLVHTVSH